MKTFPSCSMRRGGYFCCRGAALLTPSGKNMPAGTEDPSPRLAAACIRVGTSKFRANIAKGYNQGGTGTGKAFVETPPVGSLNL
jgi:hypothetical protein